MAPPHLTVRRHARRGACVAALLVPLIGCAGAPNLVLAGAYFPAWLVCCTLGGTVAVLARLVWLLSPYNNRMPYPLAVAAALGAVVGGLAWFAWSAM